MRRCSGKSLQRAFELVETGGVRALHPTRERVDGGEIPQATVSDAQIRAFGDLTCAMTALGQEGESLIQDFFGRVLCLRDIAARRGANFERERGYMGYRLRECPKHAGGGVWLCRIIFTLGGFGAAQQRFVRLFDPYATQTYCEPVIPIRRAAPTAMSSRAPMR